MKKGRRNPWSVHRRVVASSEFASTLARVMEYQHGQHTWLKALAGKATWSWSKVVEVPGSSAGQTGRTCLAVPCQTLQPPENVLQNGLPDTFYHFW